MPLQLVDVEQEQTKRRLRQQIGRLRRRIDHRLRASQREGRRLLAWQTYLRRYPGSAMLTAFGVALAFSAGLGGRRWTRRFALKLVRRGARSAGQGLWRDLQQIWTDSTPKQHGNDAGGGDDE